MGHRRGALRVRAHVVELLHDDEIVLVADETGNPKKGTATAGRSVRALPDGPAGGRGGLSVQVR
ncbi:hypothetical protein ACTWQF_24520 [Streptomyces sp. 8N114]|uniref:hypothetical protein n=1 Tax=Streptomyces sp. 8N114 TaxID=3457419 RepID=UPI003FD081C9